MKVFRVAPAARCKCPLYCKYCGAHRLLGRDGHYCPTGSCRQHERYEGCTLPREPKEQK